MLFFYVQGVFQNPTITGVLDWDDCEALPVELAFRVSTWLWSSGECDAAQCNIFNSSDFVTLIGENPDVQPMQTRATVREAFIHEIETLIPGFMATARSSFNNGLQALGCVARFGITPPTAGLSRHLLTLYGWEHEAQCKFEALMTELETNKQKNILSTAVH